MRNLGKRSTKRFLGDQLCLEAIIRDQAADRLQPTKGGLHESPIHRIESRAPNRCPHGFDRTKRRGPLEL